MLCTLLRSCVFIDIKNITPDFSVSVFRKQGSMLSEQSINSYINESIVLVYCMYSPIYL